MFIFHLSRARACLTAFVLALCVAGVASAQAWPTRPVRVVVPYGPGGIADIAARAVAQKMAVSTGQPFIVDNRPGADTRIGTEIVAKAEGDAYTLLLAGGGFAVNNSLFPRQLPYDTAKDFIPLGLVVSNPLVLVVGAVTENRSVKDILAQAAQSGKPVLFASGGKGTLSHMSMELFASTMNVPMTHVPYKGGSAHVADVVSGVVTGAFDNPSSALPLVKSGKFRPVAVTSAKRSPAWPDVPTMQESGVKGFEVMNWFGMFAPKGVPAPVTKEIAAHLEKALADPELNARFAGEGVFVGGMMGDVFGRFVAAETVKWGEIIRSRGIRAD